MNIHEQKVESKSYHTIEMNEFVERREREREKKYFIFLSKKIIRRERKKKLISYIVVIIVLISISQLISRFLNIILIEI